MNLTFRCPQCQATVRQEVDAGGRRFACPACAQEFPVTPEAFDGSTVRECLVCPSKDLFMRKDFPQRLGVALVAIGVVGSSVAWYYANLPWTFGILFATALADLLLYLFVGDALMCYRCGAQYRGLMDAQTHGAFSLETHEKHRQASARADAAAARSPGG